MCQAARQTSQGIRGQHNLPTVAPDIPVSPPCGPPSFVALEKVSRAGRYVVLTPLILVPSPPKSVCLVGKPVVEYDRTA